MSYQIESKQIETRYAAAVEFQSDAAGMGAHMGEAFGAVMQYLQGAGTQPAGPAIARYSPPHDDGTFDVAAGFYVAAPIEGDGNVIPIELPAGEVACTTHMGPYESLPQAYDAIMAWARENGRETETIMWEEYHSPPETPPAETRTEVYWPLKSS